MSGRGARNRWRRACSTIYRVSLARQGREDGVGHGRREREGARSRIEVSMEASRAGEQGGGHFCVTESFFGEGSLVLVQREATFDYRRIPFSLKGLIWSEGETSSPEFTAEVSDQGSSRRLFFVHLVLNIGRKLLLFIIGRSRSLTRYSVPSPIEV